MRICHISDTHGNFNTLFGKFDIIVHSGDFLPNSKAIFGKNRIENEINFQKSWLSNNINVLKKFIGNHPFIFINGNHDFIDPDYIEEFLKENGVNAINATNKMINYNDFKFYGFPYIPYIKNFWNYEKTVQEMKKEIELLSDYFNNNHIDILISHCPPYKILDKANSNENIGNSSLSDAINYIINKENLPTHILCGHCHESFGIKYQLDILFSNAATTHNLIEIF